jgi:hypothetical protein
MPLMAAWCRHREKLQWQLFAHEPHDEPENPNAVRDRAQLARR